MALAHAPTRAHPHAGWQRLVRLVGRGTRWLALASDASPGAQHVAGNHSARAAEAISVLPVEFERFVREHERPVLNYLWRITGEEQTAYDLTQEVFLRAWQRFEAIRAYEQPRAWLLRVASNLAFTYLKRRKLSVAVARADASDGTDHQAASDPAGRLAERDAVRGALLGLPARRRAALVLREIYGLSAAEIGVALGLSVPAVRMELHRAREQFRARYRAAEGSADDGAHT